MTYNAYDAYPSLLWSSERMRDGKFIATLDWIGVEMCGMRSGSPQIDFRFGMVRDAVDQSFEARTDSHKLQPL
jgi:hypothetical protein